MNSVIEKTTVVGAAVKSGESRTLRGLRALWERVNTLSAIQWVAAVNGILLGYLLLSVLEAAFRPFDAPLAAWNFFNIVSRL